jgi:hypothetical protein
LSKEDAVSDFIKITVEDSGIGFNDSEFERFMNLQDDRKGIGNKGTGRIQYIHFFNKTTILSTYKDNESATGYKQRKIILSKSREFLKENTIIYLESENEVDASKSHTILTFESLLEDGDLKYYSDLTAEKIKGDLVRHYLKGFCTKRENLPRITIKAFINDEEIEALDITHNDIPNPIQDKNIEIQYSTIKENNIEKIHKTEVFNLKSFTISKDELDQNQIRLISKGENAGTLKLECLLSNDQIDGKRYLFLLSGEYIDKRDGNTRGNIVITKKRDFKKKNNDSFIIDDEILLEDMIDITNETIVSLHKEIQEKNEEKNNRVKELQQIFLLNNETIEPINFKISDTDKSILEKIYEADAHIAAEKDAKMKLQLEKINSLTPQCQEYQSQLDNIADEFLKIIPLQKRTTLSRYIARRKIVLELFQKVLDKELNKFYNGGDIDEKLLHNLIFQRSSDDPENSDLWLLGDEYIHFKGFSEHRLGDVTIDGIKIFKDNFSAEEDEYLNSGGERRLSKRPDVLLFPQEGKCIIIEFKAIDTNVAKHLTQINYYASLIRNYTIESYNIVSFYGYLIGENIKDRDVRGTVSSFEHSSHLDYWFNPSERVIGFDGRSDGSIYTEVIKYSTLLKRAQLRNKVFIDKLINNKT